jgi:hypothetical protein
MTANDAKTIRCSTTEIRTVGPKNRACFLSDGVAEKRGVFSAGIVHHYPSAPSPSGASDGRNVTFAVGKAAQVPALRRLLPVAWRPRERLLSGNHFDWPTDCFGSMCDGRRTSLAVSAEPGPVAQPDAVLHSLATGGSLALTNLQS